MKYQHTPRFQQLLQVAMKKHMAETRTSQKELRSAGTVTCAISSLNRFFSADLSETALVRRGIALDSPIEKNRQMFLNYADAKALWEIANSENTIEFSLRQLGTSKKQYENQHDFSDFASAFESFYNTKRRQIDALLEKGIEGDYFCYKPSFRRDGFTVKSSMKITLAKEDYFEVIEEQKTSGEFEADHADIVEISEGIAIVKSGRMWIFMRDKETEQPRVFCFHKPKFSAFQEDLPNRDQSEKRNTRISSMKGFLLEGAKGNENNAFLHHAILINDDVEREAWKSKYPGITYNSRSQIDVYPTSEKQFARYEKTAREMKYVLDDEVIEYLDQLRQGHAHIPTLDGSGSKANHTPFSKHKKLKPVSNPRKKVRRPSSSKR